MVFDLGMELDKAHYALLNAVSLDVWAAYLLAGEAPMEAIMNMPSHGLPEDELTEHFFRLWTAGLIECSIEESGPPVAPDFEIARQQFEHTRDWPPMGKRALIYRLSGAGGRLWEHFASPDWNKFFRTDSPHSKEWSLASSNRYLVELLQKCRRYHPPPIEGTDRWTTHQPWNATYWKTLPIGYEFAFRFEKHEWPPPEGRDLQSYNEVESACEQVETSWRQWTKSFEEICKEHFGEK
jgi:hypothetical protein